MKEISVQNLKNKIDNKEDFQLIDVRDEHEYEICNLNGQLIPMATIFDQTDLISRDMPVILHCKSGARSKAVIMELEKRHGFDNLYNLTGGISAYSREIDPSIPLY